MYLRYYTAPWSLVSGVISGSTLGIRLCGLFSNSKLPAKGVDTHVLGKKPQLSTRGGGIFFAEEGGGGGGNERAF